MDALKKRRSHLQQALKFGYWQKDAAALKKLLEDHLALARAEHVGQTAAGFVALGDLETDNKANKAGLERLIESGKEMIDEDHFAKSEIQRTIDDLLALMARLDEALAEKRRKLELQQKIDEFRSELRNMSVWIAEKLPAAESDNYGSTLEEVVALQASLVRLDNEVNGEFANFSKGQIAARG